MKKPILYEPQEGEQIEVTATLMISLANQNKCEVHTYFNNIQIIVVPNDNLDDIVSRYIKERKRYEEVVDHFGLNNPVTFN